MNVIISFCLRKRLTVLMLTALLAAVSFFVVKDIPVDVFPELKVPRVTIQTEASGLTAEEVERYVTIPVESAMNGTAGVLKGEAFEAVKAAAWTRITCAPPPAAGFRSSGSISTGTRTST